MVRALVGVCLLHHFAACGTIAQGAGWLTTHDEITRLREGAVSEAAQQELEYPLSVSSAPPAISCRLDEDGGTSFRVAQYEVRDVSALEAKLAQYPRGTTFGLEVTAAGGASEAEQAAIPDRLRAFLGARGMGLR